MDTCRLKKLPLYGLGVSSGASFVLKLPRFFKASNPKKWKPPASSVAQLVRCMPIYLGWAQTAALLQGKLAIEQRSFRPYVVSGMICTSDACLLGTTTAVCHHRFHLVQFSGILSEALGIDPGPWSLNKIDGRECWFV